MRSRILLTSGLATFMALLSCGTTDTAVSITPTPTGAVDVDLPTATTEVSLPLPGEPIAFSDGSGALNPLLTWHDGGLPVNDYRISADQLEITILTDSSVDQWGEIDTAPLIAYAVAGNFVAQVEIMFQPDLGFGFAGIGVRSAADSNHWIRVERRYGIIAGEGNRAGEQGDVLAVSYSIPNDADHMSIGDASENALIIRIEREDAWMSVLAYSSDGETLEDSGFAIPGDLPIDAEVFLVVGSLGDAGASAQFRNFVVVPK